jgi:hypothetical protein
MHKDLMKQVKGTMKLGVTSMVGGSVLGTMSGLPGMPSEAKNTANISMSAMNLANVGNLANIGMNILPKGKKNKHVGY